MARKKTTPEWIEIGNRIKLLIEAKGWTQAALAEMIGISRSHLNGIIAGGPPPSIEVAKRLKRKTGATLEWLYDGEAGTLPVDLHKLIVAIEVVREKRESDSASRERQQLAKAS